MKEEMLVNKKTKIYFISAICGDVQLMIAFKKRLAGWYCYTNGAEMGDDWQLIFLDKAKDPEELLVNADVIFVDPVIAWRKRSLSAQLRELNRKREESTLVVSLPKPVPKRRDFFADPGIFIKKFHQAVGESREEDTVELPKVKTELQDINGVTEDSAMKVSKEEGEEEGFVIPEIAVSANVLISLRSCSEEIRGLETCLKELLTADSEVTVKRDFEPQDLSNIDVLITEVRLKKSKVAGETEKNKKIPSLKQVDWDIIREKDLRVIVIDKDLTPFVLSYLGKPIWFLRASVNGQKQALQVILWNISKKISKKSVITEEKREEGEAAIA